MAKVLQRSPQIARQSFPTVLIPLPGYTRYASFQPLTSVMNAAAGLLTRTGVQYPTHVPLNSLQKSAVGLFSLIGAFSDPRRGDLVAAAGETTGLLPLRAMRDRMQRTESGRSILLEKPKITNASVARAWTLPSNTFGGAYAKFMGDRNFKADERPPVRFVDDPELAYIVERARQVHDFWHVLFNCHTNAFGEVALKAVEFVQTGMPMTALAVVAGEWRLKPEDRRVLNTVYLPWALKAGTRAADLMCIYYEKHLEEDLEELRQRWRILPAPHAPQNDPGRAPGNPVPQRPPLPPPAAATGTEPTIEHATRNGQHTQ